MSEYNESFRRTFPDHFRCLYLSLCLWHNHFLENVFTRSYAIRSVAIQLSVTGTILLVQRFTNNVYSQVQQPGSEVKVRYSQYMVIYLLNEFTAVQKRHHILCQQNGLTRSYVPGLAYIAYYIAIILIVLNCLHACATICQGCRVSQLSGRGRSLTFIHTSCIDIF